MILRDLLQLVLFIGLLAALSPLLGRYVHQVFSGRRTFLHPVLGPVERGVYSLSGIHPDENQTWSRYAVSLIGFSLAGFLLTFGVLLFQDKLPLNPQGFPGLSWDLALNTAVSFLTNTNWQSYGGETTMSHFSQMVALTYQNFVSAAVGIAVCAAVVRGHRPQRILVHRQFLVRSRAHYAVRVAAFEHHRGADHALAGYGPEFRRGRYRDHA